MCNCQTWARYPQQGTHDGKYPPPEHHVDCEDYKTELFIRINYDGQWCLMEPDDAADLIAEGDDGYTGYTTEKVYLTRCQFEQMPEFTGF